MNVVFFLAGMATMFVSIMVPQPYMLPVVLAGCGFAAAIDIYMDS